MLELFIIPWFIQELSMASLFLVMQVPLNLKKIQTLQNQLLKVLLRKDYRFSTNELHNSMDLLKIDDIADQEILSFVHNYFSKICPQFLMITIQPLLNSIK